MALGASACLERAPGEAGQVIPLLLDRLKRGQRRRRQGGHHRHLRAGERLVPADGDGLGIEVCGVADRTFYGIVTEPVDIEAEIGLGQLQGQREQQKKDSSGEQAQRPERAAAGRHGAKKKENLGGWKGKELLSHEERLGVSARITKHHRAAAGTDDGLFALV
jgi:hypothetical protein